ncbi:unnamed protein product [Cladocopium goreaui]|uniref:Pescadillo homolog (Nucleolar protein 7 homolog) n=1 Tax=Cladocopium goreaui TaxID=2562237 RepID=A0A9P1CV47_9DINO|nr:unnamed protein product [Cladocopium goreaui]
MAKRKSKVKRNPKGGVKKGDKIHGQKKGKKGEAAAYITRAQALAKLQLPLADFRKLCILKGIYPRDPKKKAQGNDKTYYHHKDIAFLRHEPLLNKFFELKTFMKKFKRLMGRREIKSARRLEERKPKYTLHHLVRERYPSFDDAIRDLDDAVSMLALFQSLSADQARDIPVDAITEATQLYQEFQLYVIRAQALRKVFASIKGYYFQAEIGGQSVTWLAPHQFAQDLPAEVDFRVMLTFLEFYRAMVKFVNFRLYSDLGLAYPPRRDVKLDSSSADVAALEVEMREAGKAQQLQSEQTEKDNADVATGVLADFGDQSEAKPLRIRLLTGLWVLLMCVLVVAKVRDKVEGYIPRQREVLDRFAEEVSGKIRADTAEDAKAEGGSLATGGLHQFGEELRAESEGLWHSEYQKKREDVAAAKMVTEDVGEVEMEEVKPQRHDAEPFLLSSS